MKVLIRFLALAIVATSTVSAAAQDVTPQSSAAEPATERPNAIEEQAYPLLEEVIAGSRLLKLPENRSRLQIVAADLLWQRDQVRARLLFSEAAGNVVDLERQTAGKPDQSFGQRESAAQLRQQLILTVARHEPSLAYQLLQKTRPQKAGLPDGRVPEDETYLEQLLLTQVMAKDPTLALEKAEGMLDRGEFSHALASILELLQDQDKTGAARLTEKILGRLQADTLLNNYGALSLALEILRTGPRSSEPPLPAQSASPSTVWATVPGFSVPAYQQLLETAVVAALKGRATESPRGAQSQNAGDLLLNLRPLLPQIDQYLPARAQAVRQRINAFDDQNKSRAGLDKLTYLTQQGTSGNLMTAAASARLAMRDSFYQQAALKAGESTRLEELRQTLETASNHDRVNVLLQLAEATKTDNAKDSRQFLDEAYGLVTRPATNYKQLEDRRQVAHVLAALEPQRSLQILESGINQLNELLPAAASLNGFEFQIFTDGEMPLPGNSQLGAEVVRYAQELSLVAKNDFPGAVAAAEQFQYPEARLFARLSIVQAVLGRE